MSRLTVPSEVYFYLGLDRGKFGSLSEIETCFARHAWPAIEVGLISFDVIYRMALGIRM